MVVNQFCEYGTYLTNLTLWAHFTVSRFWVKIKFEVPKCSEKWRNSSLSDAASENVDEDLFDSREAA